MKKFKKLKKNQKRILFDIGISLSSIIVGLIIIGLISTLTSKRYFYRYGDLTGHSNNCYHDKDGVYCDISTKVDWFYEVD